MPIACIADGEAVKENEVLPEFPFEFRGDLLRDLRCLGEEYLLGPVERYDLA